jgi:hypothetical protein
VPAALVAGGPEQARYRMLQEGSVVVLTTAPDALPQGVVARRLEPARGLAFTLLWRADAPSPALREFVRIAGELTGRPPSSRPALALAA